MKILVTGGYGQLGLSIKKLSANYPDWDWLFTDYDELDITKKNLVEKFIGGNDFTHLINCAAFNEVDMAEKDVKRARLINQTGVKYLAQISSKHKLSFIHISTDYVFDGNHFRPYREYDFPNPTNIYGLTKLEGEMAAMDNCRNTIIIRTSWLYSEFGKNFLKTMLRLSSERSQINVISDQIGTPTYAGDLAQTILMIIEQKRSVPEPQIYHYSNEGVASWYDFAYEIISLTGKACEIMPVPTEEYPLPASRPFYSVLSKIKIKNDFGVTIPNWRNSLHKCLDQLQSQPI